LNKYICYTLDLEEDHAGLLHNYYEGLQYLENLIKIIKENKLNVSFFIQTKLIEKFPERIEVLRENKFDIHLHSYYHEINRFLNYELERIEISKSKDIYKSYFNENPIGYRSPAGIVTSNIYYVLKDLGFKFDSSIFPTIRPGYFNNISKPLYPYYVDGILEIPFSMISPLIRIPLSLSYMKLFSTPFFLKKFDSKVIIFDLHLHDIYKLRNTNLLKPSDRLPYLINRDNGMKILLNFNKKLLNEGYRSSSISRVYEYFGRQVNENNNCYSK